MSDSNEQEKKSVLTKQEYIQSKLSNIGTKEIFMVTAGTIIIGLGAFVASRFRVTPANQFIAKTGLFVDKVAVSRKTIQWPFQVIRIVNMKPITYEFIAKNCMTKERIPFELPTKFNIAPLHPDENLPGFINYVTRVQGMQEPEIHDLLQNIIIGKTREFTNTLSVEQIVADREAFKKGVVQHIEEELRLNGFEATTANISEIIDPQGVDYFKKLMLKSTEEANTTSSIAVAEAIKIREIGEKKAEMEKRQQKSTFEATAKQTETIQDQNVSEYEKNLQIKITENKRDEQLAKIEAHKQTEQRKIAIESELNIERQKQKLEELRSEEVVKAIAKAEAVVKEAQMKAEAIKISADADLFERTRKAEAEFITQTKKAEAELFEKSRNADAIKLMAEADLIAQTNKAEGIKRQLEAQAEGLEKIYSVSKENPDLATFYLGMKEGKIYEKDGLFDRLGKHQADAIRGLEPKIHIWNTGGSTGNSFTDTISSLSKAVPPILSALEQQTGIRVPILMPNAEISNKNESSQSKILNDALNDIIKK